MAESKTSARKAKVKVDTDLVLRLRASGLSWEQIAREVGHANKSSVYRLAAKALEQVPVEKIDEVRKLESMKLDRLERRLAAYIDPPGPEEARGDWSPERQLDAVRAAVRVAERRAKLLGLDAPTKSEVTTSLMRSFAPEEIKAMTNEQLAELMAAREKADR